jgi:HSP20 family protein
MANLLRRRERETSTPMRAWDPFRGDPFQMMRDALRWDPFRELESLGNLPERMFVPDVELKETKDAYVFKADLPGVQEKDLDVSLTGNRIQISGRREEEERREDERYYAYERTYGAFTRSFTLPEGANAEEVSAELKDGVLHVKVPKRPEVQSRRISIGGGTDKQLDAGAGQNESAAQGKGESRAEHAAE